MAGVVVTSQRFAIVFAVEPIASLEGTGGSGWFELHGRRIAPRLRGAYVPEDEVVSRRPLGIRVHVAGRAAAIDANCDIALRRRPGDLIQDHIRIERADIGNAYSTGAVRAVYRSADAHGRRYVVVGY